MQATTNTRQQGHAVHYGYGNGGRDVLCQGLVQNSAWRDCSDIQISRFFSPGNDVSFQPTGLGCVLLRRTQKYA